MYPNQTKGISAGIFAGVFWGTPFLVPLVLTMFSAFEVAFGRFLFFGLTSLLFLPRSLRLLKQLNVRDYLSLLLLSACGFWLYTIFLFSGVKLTNGVIAALIIGLLPVTITLFSKPLINFKLGLGLVLILLGMISLLIVPLLDAKVFKETFAQVHLSGVLILFIALSMWTWFAIANAKFVKKHSSMKSIDYSCLMGIISLVCILPIFSLFYSFKNIFTGPFAHNFLFWCAILGIGASWIANVFWAYCSKNCAPSVYGSLIVSETLFGLIYSFIFQARLPYFNELVAIVLLVLGVVITIRSQR